jgi:hypothetical protein
MVIRLLRFWRGRGSGCPLARAAGERGVIPGCPGRDSGSIRYSFA